MELKQRRWRRVRKRHLKSEVALFKLSRLFHVAYVQGGCLANFYFFIYLQFFFFAVLVNVAVVDAYAPWWQRPFTSLTTTIKFSRQNDTG